MKCRTNKSSSTSLINKKMWPVEYSTDCIVTDFFAITLRQFWDVSSCLLVYTVKGVKQRPWLKYQNQESITTLWIYINVRPQTTRKYSISIDHAKQNTPTNTNLWFFILQEMRDQKENEEKTHILCTPHVTLKKIFFHV